MAHRQSPSRLTSAFVLVLGPLPPPVHGAARVTAEVVDRLVKTGVTARVVNTRGNGARSQRGYHMSRIRAHGHAVRLLWAGRRATHRSLYVTGAGGAGLWYQVAVVLCGRVLGYHIFFHHHSFAYLRRRKLAMTGLTISAGKRAWHIALCGAMGRLVAKRYGSVRRVLVCSNAGLLEPRTDLRAGHPTAPASKARSLNLGHLSNLSVDKGLNVLFETLRACRAQGVPARLLLAGPPVDALSAEILRAAQKEFGEVMEYFGRLEPPEVDAFLDRLDIFLFPSAYEHEAEPLVLLEAARGGVPAIAFDVGCISDLVADHRWLIPAADSFSLAVVEILKEWDGQHRDQARARVQSTFLEHHARGTDAYDQLIPLLVGESTA